MNRDKLPFSASCEYFAYMLNLGLYLITVGLRPRQPKTLGTKGADD